MEQIIEQINDKPSKTEKKKQAQSLQMLGEKLVKLPAEEIKDIDLPTEIYDAVKFAKTIKTHGALKRQIQHIGSLMRKHDHTSIQESIHNKEQGNYKRANELKKLEKQRDELIAGNKKLMEEILKNHPDADRQHLSQLVRDAAKEISDNKPLKSYRTLFRYLRKIAL